MARRAQPDEVFPHRTRLIEPGDRELVRQIDRDAFEVVRRERGELRGPLRLRTAENMAAALDRPSPGVVLEAPPGRVIGYCFTHVWGSLGWLGTLGLTPERQGLGLGRALVVAGLDLLERSGCTTLALETMPDSGRNLALYTRLGLEPRRLTLLCQGAPPPARDTCWTIWPGPADRDHDALQTIAGALLSGLDPTPAARWLRREAAGETLIWHDQAGQPVCFAALRHMPRRQHHAQAFLTVEAAGCLPGAAPDWPRFLAEMQTYARQRGKSGIVLPVNSQQIALLRALLDAGMRIAHTRVRLVRGAALGAPDALLALTLAM